MLKVINNNENENLLESNSNRIFRNFTNVNEQSNSRNSNSKILKDLTQSYIHVPKKKKYLSKKNLTKLLIDNKMLTQLNFRKIKNQILATSYLTKSKNSFSLKSIEKDIQQKLFDLSMKIEKESTIIGLPNSSLVRLTTLLKEKIVDKEKENLSLFSPKHKKISNQKILDKKNSENNNNGDNDKGENNIGSSSSKKVLSRLKVLKTLKNNKNLFRVLLKKNLIYDSFDSEEEEDLEGIVISHGNTFIQIIDCLVMISSLFYMIYTPYYISIFKSLCTPVASLCKYIYFFIDILYILDLILGFFRVHHNHKFQVINKNSEVIKYYLLTQFFFDLIQAIPFFSYIFFLQDKDKNLLNHCDYYNINSFHLFLILCCNIKYLKFFKVIDIKKNSIFHKIKQSISNNDNLEQIMTFVIYFTLCIFGFYFFISIHILIGRSSYPNWINTFGFENETLLSLYLISFYFIITTTTTVGYGNIVCASSFREIIFQLILLSAGIIVYSWIVSNIGNYVKNESSASIRFDKDEAILEEIRILYPNISYNLYKKIFNHLGVRKIRQRQCDSNILINSLPHSLKTEIILSIHKKIIKNFKIFRGNQNTDFTVRLLMNFIPLFSKKNAYLIHEGQLINNIFFVKEGSLSLEACVDINDPFKSVKQYLKKNFGDIFEDAVIESDYDEQLDTSKISRKNYNNLFKKAKNEISSLLNDNNNNNEANNSINESIIIKEIGKMDYGGEVFEEANDVQLINIINISKNENFGEVYMFLNKPSPLSLKVKSKKAELFILRKSDASDISVRYPNIWSKFFKKSYLNMLSIKALTIHKIKHYWKNIGKQIKKKWKDKEQLLGITTAPQKIQNNNNNIIQTIVPRIEIDGTGIEDKINIQNKIDNEKSSGYNSGSSFKNNQRTSIKYISFNKNGDKKYRSCFNENHMNMNIQSGIKNEAYKRNTYLKQNNRRFSKFNKSELSKFGRKKSEERDVNKSKSMKKVRIDYLNKLSRKIKQLKTSKNYYKHLWKELSFNNTRKNTSNINDGSNESIQSFKNKSFSLSKQKSYKSDKIKNINININFNNNNVILDKKEINLTNSSSNSNKSSNSKIVYSNKYLAMTSPINFTITEKYKNLDILTNGEYSRNVNLRITTQNFIHFFLSGFSNNIKIDQQTENNLSTIFPLKNNLEYGLQTISSVFSDRKKMNIHKKSISEVSFCPSKKSSICVNDGKIIIIYDKFKNYFYSYGNNKEDKKRLSDSRLKTYELNINEPKYKINISSVKNDSCYNQNSKRRDTLVENNGKVSNFYFNNTNKFKKTLET